MSRVISKGDNFTLAGGRIQISATPPGIDLTVLCLRAESKVGDDDFVFYNQPVSPDGAVRLAGGAIEMDLPDIAASTDKLVVAASVDTGSFGGIALHIGVTELGGDTYDLPITGLSTETTVVLAEVYRRAGAWKIRNVGQGYATGLAVLATDFGITVDDAPGPVPAADAPARSGTPPPVPESGSEEPRSAPRFSHDTRSAPATGVRPPRLAAVRGRLQQGGRRSHQGGATGH